MTLEEIKEILEKWSSTLMASEQVLAKLKDIVGSSPECPLSESIFAMAEAYTKATETIIGDDFGWLQWYWLENEMGAKSMEAKASNWDAMRVIATNDDLAELIYADLKEHK